jgi:hypothetical protein
MSYTFAQLTKLMEDPSQQELFFEIVNFDGPDKILMIEPDHVFLMCAYLIKSKPDHQAAAFILVQTIFSVQMLTEPGLFIADRAMYFIDTIAQMPDPIMRIELLKIWTFCFNCSNWTDDDKLRDKLNEAVTITVNQILFDPKLSHNQKYDAFVVAGSDRRDPQLAQTVEDACLKNGTAIQYWIMKVREAEGLKYKIMLFNTLIAASELTNNQLLRRKAVDMVDYDEALLEYEPIAKIYNQEIGFEDD